MHNVAEFVTLLNGMEYCFSMFGDTNVILCLRKAVHALALDGKKPKTEKDQIIKGNTNQ